MDHTFGIVNGDKESPKPGALLLVEDDYALGELIKAVIDAFFCVAVYHAASAKEARRLWAEHQHSVAAILSDLTLPGVAGENLVRELIAQHPHVGVVLMTGHLRDQAELSRTVGRQIQLLLKPFTPADLRQVLAPHLVADQEKI